MKTIWILFGVGILAAVVCGAAGCSDMTIAGLRFAPKETQKQSAQAADSLAGSLVATGARPGSPAVVALAKMTRPAAVYAGPPADPIDTNPLAIVEAGQWRYKDDVAAAERLRGSLRARAMALTTERLARLVEAIGDSKAAASAFLDRIAAISDVAVMADDLADSVPDPVSPDASQTPAMQKAVEDLAKAAGIISAAANKAATARPDAGTTADKLLDAADKTAGKTVQVLDRGVGIFQKYQTEIVGLLSVLGVGGYAMKQRGRRAKAEAAIPVASDLSHAAGREEALLEEIATLKKAAIDG